MTELLRLRRQVDELQAALARSRITAPKEAEGLAQGDDVHELDCTVSTLLPGKYKNENWGYWANATWNEIFAAVAPLMIHEAPEAKLKEALDAFVLERLHGPVSKDMKFDGYRVVAITLSDQDFQTIKIQLRALGLVAKSEKVRSVKDSGSYWTLTPYGDEVMTRLRAIRKMEAEPGPAHEVGPQSAG